MGLWKPATPGSFSAAAQVPGACAGALISGQPQAASECNGLTANFSVSATGTPPINFQWQIQTSAGVWATMGSDPLPLPCGGFAFASLPLSNQTPIGVHPCAGVSTYQIRCVATNSCGSMTSNPAALTVVPVGGGDMNGDGRVDGADVPAFVAAVIQGGVLNNADCAGDMNADGQVNAADVGMFIGAALGN